MDPAIIDATFVGNVIQSRCASSRGDSLFNVLEHAAPFFKFNFQLGEGVNITSTTQVGFYRASSSISLRKRLEVDECHEGKESAPGHYVHTVRLRCNGGKQGLPRDSTLMHLIVRSDV